MSEQKLLQQLGALLVENSDLKAELAKLQDIRDTPVATLTRKIEQLEIKVKLLQKHHKKRSRFFSEVGGKSEEYAREVAQKSGIDFHVRWRDGKGDPNCSTVYPVWNAAVLSVVNGKVCGQMVTEEGSVFYVPHVEFEASLVAMR